MRNILILLGLQSKVHKSMRKNEDRSLLVYVMVPTNALAQGDEALNGTQASPALHVSSLVGRLN